MLNVQNEFRERHAFLWDVQLQTCRFMVRTTTILVYSALTPSILCKPSMYIDKRVQYLPIK